MTGLILSLGIFLVICQLGCLEVSGSDCSRYSNGCSIPFGANFFFKQTFTPACDRHDACYKCGVMWNLSRRRCDHTFKDHLKRICRQTFRNPSFNYVRCKFVASIYYAAVRAGGGMGFKTRPKPWCTPAVRACLPI
ncbi:hypothetical protein SNE40_011618 [Patella caerulea]|uniref:Conodipine-M alpha chain n=1 Tax=Patella caerulea TaxID=87958 RepID=A0AAN8PPJ6_PATCE